MNTYWDEFMDLLQAGKINDEYGHPLAMTFLTPRRMLQAFYDWLGEKGQIVHGCPYPQVRNMQSSTSVTSWKVEHLTEAQGVGGSIPSLTTNVFDGRSQ